MSQENVEIVRRVDTAINRVADLWRAGQEWESAPEWSELFEPDMVLEDAAEMPGSAVYSGLDEVKRWFRTGAEIFIDGRWEPRDLLARGPHVVVAAHGDFRGSSSGVHVEVDVTHVFTVRNGRIAHLRAFFDRKSALEAAGLSESLGSLAFDESGSRPDTTETPPRCQRADRRARKARRPCGREPTAT